MYHQENRDNKIRNEYIIISKKGKNNIFVK